MHRYLAPHAAAATLGVPTPSQSAAGAAREPAALEWRLFEVERAAMGGWRGVLGCVGGGGGLRGAGSGGG
jgi:hypothetical protein